MIVTLKESNLAIKYFPEFFGELEILARDTSTDSLGILIINPHTKELHWFPSFMLLIDGKPITDDQLKDIPIEISTY